jgi:hypothetical protein
MGISCLQKQHRLDFDFRVREEALGTGGDGAPAKAVADEMDAQSGPGLFGVANDAGEADFANGAAAFEHGQERREINKFRDKSEDFTENGLSASAAAARLGAESRNADSARAACWGSDGRLVAEGEGTHERRGFAFFNRVENSDVSPPPSSEARSRRLCAMAN